MSILAMATKGVTLGPQLYVFYGPPGVGKTSLAAQFPQPIILDLDEGSDHIDVTRITKDKLPTLSALNQVLDEIMNGVSGFKTLIVDSITALEKLVETAVCAEFKVNSVGEIPWGGGTVAVKSKVQDIANKLKEIKYKKNMDVVVIGHTQIKGFTDPQLNASYDRYTIQCNEKVAQAIMAAADNVFFCKYQTEVTAIKGKDKSQAFSTGERVMLTEWRAGFEGKNRLGLPLEIPMSYEALKAAIESSKPKASDELLADIKELLKKSDELTAAKVESALKDAGTDQTKLLRIKQKLSTIVAA